MRRFSGKRFETKLWAECGVKAVGIFMAVVIAGTFMSRFASSVLTPRVETEYAVSGTVSTEILQDVVIDGDKKTPVYVYPGLLAQEIYVSAGKKIEQGDPLMRVDVAAVRSEYLEKKLEQKKLKEQYWYTWGDEMAVMDDKIAVVDEQISYLGKLMDDNGVVCSELNGLISESRVGIGNKTTEEAAFVITEKSDSYTIKMSVTEEQRRYIEKGDKVTVQMDDSGVNTEVSAVYSNVENGQGYIVEAVVPGNTFDVGDSVLAEISHQSEKYGSVVSVSAIHADVSGSYVLVERPKDTLLGTEYVAEKVYVTVGDTNNYDAGLKKSPFTGDDKIIVSSDKKVEAGDTVREK